MIGQTISHYKIVSKIGEGGMGQVFLADDTELDRQVALKILPRNVGDNEEALERFKREAKAAAALDHPNIITIHEIGTHEGQSYIVMSYVKGQTLSDIIRSGEPSIERILEIVLHSETS